MALLGNIAAAPDAFAAGASGRPGTVIAPNGKLFVIPAGSKPDAIAFYHNGFKPALVSSGHLTPTTLPGIATERGQIRQYRTASNHRRILICFIHQRNC